MSDKYICISPYRNESLRIRTSSVRFGDANVTNYTKLPKLRRMESNHQSSVPHTDALPLLSYFAIDDF